MKTKNYIRSFISVCAAMLALTGCMLDDTDRVCPEQEKVSLRISLDIPGLSGFATRGMTPTQEADINYPGLQVLAFEETPSGEMFRYKASIESIVNRTLTMKVPSSRSGEKYRFVVIANSDPQNPAEGTPKTSTMSQYRFDCLGRWNVSDANTGRIPMWGEFDQTFVVKEDRNIQILLQRALARVDIGNRFAFRQPDGDPEDMETVLGLDNFKIKEIRVYRTKNLAYSASAADLMSGGEVIKPNIPAGAQFNTDNGIPMGGIADADAHPLTYILPEGADRYIREIYIPESVVIDDQSSMENVPCVVIGGYYGVGNTSTVTYYRADFASYQGSSLTEFRPILRNHRYIFDIKSVNGPGFIEPEEALNSLDTKMVLQVVDWNEVPLNHYVQGNYFLRVSTRDVLLEARTETAGVFASDSVIYETNLPLDAVNKPFTYTWSSGTAVSQYFDVSFDYARGKIVFTAKQDNVNLGPDMLSDVLTLRVENFQLTIRVNQKASNAAFELDCESIVVNGKYREGVPLNYTNYISMRIVSENTLVGAEYEVRTNEVNGIYFLASGEITTEGTVVSPTEYVYDLILEGHGTLVNQTDKDVLLPFNVTITSSSTLPGTCSARIVVGYQTKRILTIGANASYRYGYVLEPNTGSRAMVDASINFGTDPNSTVTIETNESGHAFTIEYMTAGRGMTGERINYDELLKNLNTFKPDIILTGQAINFLPLTESATQATINLLASFVNEGGVMLMFNEYYPNSSSIQQMVRTVTGNTSLSGADMGITTSNLIYTLPGGDQYADDPVLNGPFGDMRNLTWGSDGTALYGFLNLTASDAIIYSTGSNDRVCMFRHPTKPFMFIGDGGFISNSQRYIGGAYQGSHVYFPFAIDAAYRPIPRTNYTSASNVAVLNSQIFGNILAWAVDRAEMEGIRYPETGNKFPITP